ncbi:hypothetical protein E8E14_006761 [Neopestalotiopsis sp. 37M]|nr:hypothetical protein E8E14_006761 [Neopestalotiopsis sp. 37M]
MTSETTPHPRVGVAAIIRNASGQLIVGKRLSSHGKGTWQFPGGHLEYGEEFFTCAERETLEETGLRVKAVRLAAVTNSVFVEDHKHYITLFVLCEMLDAEATPQILEPEKCESWEWVTWDTVCDWVDHQGDQSDTKWADKKCFLPIIHLVRENRNVSLEP